LVVCDGLAARGDVAPEDGWKLSSAPFSAGTPAALVDALLVCGGRSSPKRRPTPLPPNEARRPQGQDEKR